MKNWRSGNLHVWPNELKRAGDKTRSHRHEFGHTTIIMRGIVEVVLDHGDGTRTGHVKHAPSAVYVPAGVLHELHALEDDSLYWCVFSDPDPLDGTAPGASPTTVRDV